MKYKTVYNNRQYEGEENDYFLYPNFNVFFYPYPFVADSISFIKTTDILLFVLTRDIEIVLGVQPSPNTRTDRFYIDEKKMGGMKENNIYNYNDYNNYNSDYNYNIQPYIPEYKNIYPENNTKDKPYLISCDKLSYTYKNSKGQDKELLGRGYDPCFTKEFINKYPEINGNLFLASEDTSAHLQNDPEQRFFSKYRTNFIDNKDRVGVPEIILHPSKNRLNNKSEKNYKLFAVLPHSSFQFDKGWEAIDNLLSPRGAFFDTINPTGKNYHMTIDLATKMYVIYELCDVAIKNRCVPIEEPYKLRYLNNNYNL